MMRSTEVASAPLSPAERGEINVTRLRDYLGQLRRSGQTLPMNNDGEPNRTAIAAACGFRRNVLHTNKAAIRLLNEFLGRESDTSDPTRDGGYNPAQATQIGLLEQRVIHLEQRLAVALAERDALREQLVLYRVIEEDVLKKGRRVIP